MPSRDDRLETAITQPTPPCATEENEDEDDDDDEDEDDDDDEDCQKRNKDPRQLTRTSAYTHHRRPTAEVKRQQTSQLKKKGVKKKTAAKKNKGKFM